MQSLNQLKQQVQTIESIKLITEAFGDIATFRIKATRKSKEHNIAYFQEINRIYQIVKTIAYKNQASKKVSAPIARENIVCVLLTANSHFYGNLDTELTKFFIEKTVKLDCSRIVVGSFAKEFLKARSFSQPYESIIFKNDSPSYQEVVNLSKKVFSSRRILVFHTKFVTLLNQVPNISDVSPTYLETKHVNLPFHYISEPEIDKILDFFDSQMTFLMFEAIFLEIDYARLAARMISMNQAEQNADKLLKSQEKELLKFKKQKLNLEILETYSGLIGKNYNKI